MGQELHEETSGLAPRTQKPTHIAQTRKPIWHNLSPAFRGRKRRPDWRLQVPPEPAILTGNAIPSVLRDVGLLLDYLNRSPEPRLSRYFESQSPAMSQQSPVGLPRAAGPPCIGQAYFLGRIAAIAALGSDAKPTKLTEPEVPRGSTVAESDRAATADMRHLGDLAFLIWSRDVLATLVAPATLDTIRVTRAYRAGRMMDARNVKADEGAQDTADERDLFMSRYGLEIAKRVRCFQVMAMLLLWFSLYLSFMVYSGQVLLNENTALQTARTTHETRLKEAATQDEAAIQATLRDGHATGALVIPRGYCDITMPVHSTASIETIKSRAGSKNSALVTPLPTGDASPGSTTNLRLYISDRQRSLCGERQHLAQRENELKRTNAIWMEAASPLIAFSTPLPGVSYFVSTVKRQFTPRQDPLGIDRALESQHYAMQQLINGLLAGIMPAMYAALGALASLFRRLAKKADDEQLGPADHGGMMSSLVLGGLTGAVIGLFANVMPSSQGAGLPLTTTALALLAGYAADRVFAMFDTLADRVFVFPAPTIAGKP
jgi:hypothetical protein